MPLPAPPLLTKILDPLAIELEQGELRRYLGYPGQAGAQRDPPTAVELEIRRGLPHLQPKGIYSLYPVQHIDGRHLTIGELSISGRVASFLAGADRIVVFAVTVGHGIVRRSREASADGDTVAAWALDALGSCAAEAAANALSKHLQEQFGPSAVISQRFSPGYCGMHLTAQSALFDLIDGQAIGLCLEPSMIMQPTKSISGLLGLGTEGCFGNAASPCERCNDFDCTMRR